MVKNFPRCELPFWNGANRFPRRRRRRRLFGKRVASCSKAKKLSFSRAGSRTSFFAALTRSGSALMMMLPPLERMQCEWVRVVPEQPDYANISKVSCIKFLRKHTAIWNVCDIVMICWFYETNQHWWISFTFSSMYFFCSIFKTCEINVANKLNFFVIFCFLGILNTPEYPRQLEKKPSKSK